MYELVEEDIISQEVDNFLSADILSMTELERTALIEVLDRLEKGQLKHVPLQELRRHNPMWSGGVCGYTGHFNMHSLHESFHDCGTVACILGTARLLYGPEVFPSKRLRRNTKVFALFYEFGDDPGIEKTASVLRTFLETGEVNWS